MVEPKSCSVPEVSGIGFDNIKLAVIPQDRRQPRLSQNHALTSTIEQQGNREGG